MSNLGIIYCIINSENGKKYVGSGGFKRFDDRKYNLRSGLGIPIKMQADYTSQGSSSFKLIQIEKIAYDTKIELRQKEDEWITQFKSIENGYNTNRAVKTPRKTPDMFCCVCSKRLHYRQHHCYKGSCWDCYIKKG